MKKSYFLLVISFFLLLKLSSQVIFQEDFSGLTLINNCAHLPAALTTIKTDTLINNSVPENSPFDSPTYSNDGWAVKVINKDTCAVATSGVSPSGHTDRWMITPVIYGLTSDSKLMWKEACYSPFRFNPSNVLEVRITTDTSLPVQPSQFATNQNLLQFIAASTEGFASHCANLGAYAGMPVRIAFHENDINNPFTLWQLLVDDIKIVNIPGTINLASDNLFAETYSAAGDSLNIWQRFNNTGAPITGYTWHVTVGNFYNDSFAFTNTMNTNGRDFRYVRMKLPNISPGIYPVKTWTSSVTSSTMAPDYFPENDTLTTTIRILNIPVSRNVLAEECTGAWCGDCPMGGLELDALTATRPWLIPVSVHTGDSMTSLTSKAIADYDNAGFPTLTLDRLSAFYDPDYWGEYDFNKWVTMSDNRHSHAAPATVSIINQDYDWQTRVFTVTVAATFFNDAAGSFRMNCFLAENNITGPPNDLSDNHWNNHSYFDTVSTSAFFGMGPLLDASEYHHDHVLDTTLSHGPWGDAGIIPDSVMAGSTFYHTYSITLPVQPGDALRWKPLDMYAVAFVSNYNDFQHNQFIINAGSSPVVTGINAVATDENILSVYPNPAGENAVVKVMLENAGDVKAEFLSIDGRSAGEVLYPNLSEGENNLSLNLSGLADGIYVLKISTTQGISCCRIVHSNQ